MSAISTGKINKSIKQRKQEIETARKEGKNPIIQAFKEVSLTKFPEIDKSYHFRDLHISNNCYGNDLIYISKDEVYTANQLMMPEWLQPSPSVSQTVPKEIDEKLENLFKENAKYHRQYITLLLYYGGGFTVKEIADYYQESGTHGHKTVSKFINKARQRIIDSLSYDELKRIHWWLRISKEELGKKYDEELDKKMHEVQRS